jgi:Hydrophobic surface binding protein A
MHLNIQNLAFFYIAVTFASPLTQITYNTRDITIVSNAITSIINALTTFDTSINNLPTTPIIDITTTGAAITSALNTGAKNVQASKSLTVPDTINLVTPAQNLGDTANSTLNDLISKHDILTTAGEEATIVTLLETMKSSSGFFVDAVVSKVPSALQGPVRSVSCQVTEAFNRGILAFGGMVNGTVCI